MVDAFWLRVLLSFIVGGSYVAFSIWVSEKFGSKIGGIFISLPSTTLISLLFIGLTQNVNAARLAMTISPLAIGAQGIFIIVFILTNRWGLIKSFISASIAWFVFTSPLILLSFEDIWVSVALVAVLLILVLYYLKGIKDRKLADFKFSKNEFLIRAVFSGLVIATAVVLAKVMGPLWGGLFASFPAATLSSLYLLSRRYGTEFAVSVGKSMPLGSIGNVIFVVSAYYMVYYFDLLAGMAIAYVFCAAATAAIFTLVKKRL